MCFKRDVHPVIAYGIVCSSSWPVELICLAVQGLAVGALFGNPIFLGAAAGVIISFTDRIFTPYINQFSPGRSYNYMGLPVGLKNIALAGASMLTAAAVLKVAVVALALI